MKEMKHSALMDDEQLGSVSGGTGEGGACPHLNLIQTSEIREQRLRNGSLVKRERKFHCPDCNADVWKTELEFTQSR